jgi:RNA polymerase sigma factor (sigma-70 family)
MHEVDWGELFTWRDRVAHYWYLRHGQRYPLEEYVSAGNLGLAEAVATFRPGSGQSWRWYVKGRLRWRMMEVVRHGEGHINETRHGGLRTAYRYAVLSTDPAVLDRAVASARPHEGDPWHRARLRQALGQLSPQQQALLWRYFGQGWLMREIATHERVTESRISQRMTQTLVQLRAAMGVTTTARSVRQGVRDDVRARIRARWQQGGATVAQLADYYGLTYSTVSWLCLPAERLRQYPRRRAAYASCMASPQGQVGRPTASHCRVVRIV